MKFLCSSIEADAQQSKRLFKIGFYNACIEHYTTIIIVDFVRSQKYVGLDICQKCAAAKWTNGASVLPVALISCSPYKAKLISYNLQKWNIHHHHVPEKKRKTIIFHSCTDDFRVNNSTQKYAWNVKISFVFLSIFFLVFFW